MTDQQARVDADADSADVMRILTGRCARVVGASRSQCRRDVARPPARPRAAALHRRRGDDRRDADGDGAAARHVAPDRHAVPDAHRDLRRQAARGAHRESATRSRRPTSAIASARPGACAGRCTAFRSRSRTTSTRPIMPTTGGALAFDGFVPPYEATLDDAICATAGAIIIAKTGMTELANWVAGGMPGNYNAVGGFGLNPYDPRRDPRPATGDGRPVLATGGSSSGIGTAREPLGGQRRHRNVRIDPQPVEPDHAGRRQADGRPHQPLRRHSDHGRSGHGRADGEDR